MSKKVIRYSIHDRSEDKYIGSFRSKNEAYNYIISHYLYNKFGGELIGKHILCGTFSSFVNSLGYQVIKIYLGSGKRTFAKEYLTTHYHPY